MSQTGRYVDIQINAGNHPQMTRFLLCLTFLVVSTVSADNGVVFNSEGAIEESLVCLDPGSVDKDQGPDDPAGFCVNLADFSPENSLFTGPQHTESLLYFHPFKSQFIRAPPFS